MYDLMNAELYEKCLYTSEYEETKEKLADIIETYSSSPTFNMLIREKVGDTEISQRALNGFGVITIFYNFFYSVQISDTVYEKFGLQKEFVETVVSTMYRIQPDNFSDLVFTKEEQTLIINLISDLIGD